MFECQVIDRFTVHNHTLVVARVLSSGADDGRPLTFFEGRYHQPGMERAR
jgi:flavin reductase (DIM6/NTAB) family NADH-FMN oxidoreductase RutF